MGKARTGARVPSPLVALGSALVLACLAPGYPRWSDASGREREEHGPETTARVSRLPDGKLRLDFPRLAPEPSLQQFSVELALEALSAYRDSLAQARSRQRVTLGREGTAGDRQRTLGESWLRGQFREGFGPSPFSMPETLEGSPLLLALSLSPRYMPEGMREAAVELFSDPAFLAGVATGLVFYGLAWVAPEPLFTKAFAVSVTIALTLAFTVAELAHFGMVCLELYRATQGARTRAEIEVAAEHFGKYLGGVGLRVLVYVACRGVARALPKPPPGGLLAKLAPPRFAVAGGPSLGAATAVQAAVASGSVVIAGVAVGATSQTIRSACTDGSTRLARYEWHHLATNKNDVSPVRGGPWTPLFQALFKQAGMSMDAPENQVYLEDHAGPHPEAYHLEVYRRLRDALRACRTKAECRTKLVEKLKQIATEVCTPGSKLHSLVTSP